MTSTVQAQQRAGPLGLLAAADARISNAMYLWGTRYPRWLWVLFEYSGDGLVWLAVCLGMLLYPTGGLELRVQALNLFLGWVLDLVLVGSLKLIFKRRRPVYNQVKDFVVVVAVDQHSFPSGHATR